MNLSDAGLNPVPGPSPAGSDVRYDPVFDQLQSEIDKLSSITHTGEVDWQKIVDLSAGVITEKSKDLLAAVYLCAGMMNVQGLEGLAEGTKVLKDIIATYWDDCYPTKKRMRARINALSWWQDKSVSWLKKQPQSRSVPENTKLTLLENAKKLQELLTGLMPDPPPMLEFMNLLESLPVERKDIPSKIPVPETDNQAPPELDSPQPQSPLPTSAPLDDADAARKLLARTAMDFATLGLREDPSDPMVWKASRFAAWIKIRSLPPARNARTMIPPPQEEIRSALQRLIADGKYQRAAITAEENFTGAALWLDLQRFICTCLENIGEEYTAALDSVQSETTALLKRLPGLELLCFADSTPFADTETRAWLSTLTAGPQAGKTENKHKQNLTAKVLKDAGILRGKKDTAGALDLISQGIQRAEDGPSRTELRLAQLDILCSEKRFDMAAALADELLMEMEKRGLESWDRQLAVRILLGCLEAYSGLGGEKNLARARDMISSISRIKPSAALDLAL